jgi:hypothetical protein
MIFISLSLSFTIGLPLTRMDVVVWACDKALVKTRMHKRTHAHLSFPVSMCRHRGRKKRGDERRREREERKHISIY